MQGADNRLQPLVELSPAGEALFDRLRSAAVEHGARWRARLSGVDVARLAELLDRVRRNVEVWRRAPPPC